MEHYHTQTWGLQTSSRCTGVPEAVTLDSKGQEVKQLQSHCVEERELTDDLGDCLQRKSMQFASQQAASCLASATPDNLESLVRPLFVWPLLFWPSFFILFFWGSALFVLKGLASRGLPPASPQPPQTS